MRSWAILSLRIGLGVVFIAHGLQKAFGLFGGRGIQGFSGMVAELGFAPPMLWAYLVAYLELVGGLFVLLGLFPRVSSAFLAMVMVVAVLKVHLANGFFMAGGGFEYNFVLIAMCVSLIISGAGKISLYNKF